MYMPNRWIEFVKNWSKENNVSYGCALTKPEMKAEYHRRYPKVKTKGVAKLEESRPPEDVKSKVTYPNLKIKIPEDQENIQFEMEEMGAEEPARRKRGRPQVYMTAEEQYKAKLESNKQKRREKAAAKKLQGSGTCFGKQCGRPAAAAPPPAPPAPADPLITGITELSEGPKNMIKDFIPNKVKREPQRDQQSRAGIQELTIQLNTRLQNENMFDYQSRRQKIYPQIVKLLKRIVNRTPAEQVNLQIYLDSGISGVFKSKYYNA